MIENENPAVSPVPPTATDLISREAAIEALETWIANQPDGHYFGAWADAIYEAQQILETLPASAPPVAPSVGELDEAIEVLQSLEPRRRHLERMTGNQKFDWENGWDWGIDDAINVLQRILSGAAEEGL